MRRLSTLLAILALAAPLAFYGCSGNDGSTGATGAKGDTGATGDTGAAGAVKITDKHGAAVAEAEELEGSLPAQVVITGATANTAGVATVTFTVKNAAGTTSITGLGANDNAASFTIASLAPAGGGFSYNRWVSYIWRSSGGENQAYRERPRTDVIVEGPAGTYTYTFAQNLSTAKRPVDNVAITYDRSRTHRVFVALRGSSTGYVGGDTFDFVPAGGAISQMRDIVEDATCQKCHMNTPGHYGPWNGIVKGCVICHSPGNTLENATAYGGGAPNTLEMSVMLHKIHAGVELQSIAGLDGQYYDNPWTTLDERDDNGPLYLLGNQRSWNTAAFPAVLANCVACHTQKVAGTLAQVDNWKTVPSRAACGSCHDLINWATGVGHEGGLQANDDGCTFCHPATGAGYGKSVDVAHDWTKKDIRNIPEFDITLTTDKASYSEGDKPVLTIVLKDHFTGVTLDHNTLIQDPTAEGCIPKAGAEGTECTVSRDGLFTGANVYVVGPRAEKVAVLTYAARATVRSANAGPWDLSAGGASLRVKVDSGMPMLAYNNAAAYEGYGADELISGDITVTLPDPGADLNALFANPAAATATEVAAWLNDNAPFNERAIAYVDEALAGHANAGKLAIRSRGVSRMNSSGDVIETTTQRNIQIPDPTKILAGIFFDNTSTPYAVKTAGSADSVRKMTTANATNPKAVFSVANIQYTMDPVDDLVAGTYIVHVEYADAGRHPTNNPSYQAHGVNEPPFTDYRTPSVAVTTFQVKTATEEKPVAGNCTACHWSDAGRGFVLDNPRHNKIFDDKATDRCGACHDYASTNVSTATSQQFFEGSLSKRVHAVHNGSELNYPTITVGHEETSAFGRNWNITYPMDILNCESCHPASTTSGSWTKNPNRLACMGCHDSDAATTHMKLQTYDPTPLAPWSGDERESCKQCH